jgi:hypothetical protein
MEATVSSEHQTREQIVAEAADEKPARGRRKRKTDVDLQLDAPTAASAATEAGQEAILIEAEVEPGAQIPAELPSPDDEAARKPRSRRRTTAAQKAASAEAAEQSAAPAETAPEEPAPAKAKGKATQDKGRKTAGTRSKATQTEEPPAQPEAAEKPKTRHGTRKKAAGTGAEASSAAAQHPVDPPATGVEIIDETERGGNYYHTMRDLRNGQTVHNVTRQSARRLWLYAVQQHRRGAPEVSEVYWHPEVRAGVWRRESRAGALRYDLVSQYPDGSVRIFYGVTPDGLSGPWEEVVRLAEEAGYEGPEPAE